MELDQDLTDHTHTRLGALARKRQRVERGDGLAGQLGEAAPREVRRETARPLHEVLEQFVGGAFLGLVGARAVEHLHHEVAEQHTVHACLEQRDCELEAGVALVELDGGEADHRNIRVPAVAQGLADERDVVGGAAAAAGLGDHHGGLGQIVAAALDGLHDLARD